MACLVIHGGAGGDGDWKNPSDLDPQRITCMQSILSDIGSLLENGDVDALEAVTLAVERMEDEPLFNAGKGSVIAADGSITMDASIMRGRDRSVGSVIAMQRTRHPIRCANLILQQGWPVMLNGSAADNFAEKNQLEMVDDDWLRTELRQTQWQKWKNADSEPGSTDKDDSAILDHDGMGTVGAIALDSSGQLAAATSTGGMTGKPDGRVGDTPIIGAGTWADDRVAISCTGIGEAFIRSCAAHEVSTRIRLGDSLDEACKNTLEDVETLGGRGGLIAVDNKGDVSLPFKCMLMYRGCYRNGDVSVAIGP